MSVLNNSNSWGSIVSADVRIAKPYLIPGRVLDLGGGEGANGLWIATTQASSLHAVDQNEYALQKLRDCSPADFSLETTCGDLTSLTLQPEQYATVIATMVLQFLSPTGLENICAQICQSLQPGGTVIVSVFSKEDGSYQVISESTEDEQIAPGHFRHPKHGYFHFFDKSDLLMLFPDLRVRRIQHAYFEDLSHGKPHFHGTWLLIATKNPDKESQ